MLDLKGIRPSLPGEVARLLRARAPETAVTVCSKHWWMLDHFDPPVRTVASASSRVALARLRRHLVEHRRDGVAVHLRLLRPEVVADLHTHVPLVMTWPVDVPAALARARRIGVDAIISKNPRILVEAKDEHGTGGPEGPP
jgi:glycerophosphoryl diester phosphodiesterase